MVMQRQNRGGEEEGGAGGSYIIPTLQVGWGVGGGRCEQV